MVCWPVPVHGDRLVSQLWVAAAPRGIALLTILELALVEPSQPRRPTGATPSSPLLASSLTASPPAFAAASACPAPSALAIASKVAVAVAAPSPALESLSTAAIAGPPTWPSHFAVNS